MFLTFINAIYITSVLGCFFKNFFLNLETLLKIDYYIITCICLNGIFRHFYIVIFSQLNGVLINTTNKNTQFFCCKLNIDFFIILIIPWYVDDDNYLVVYAHWADYDRPTDLRCLQITGRINRQDVNRFDSAAFEYLPGNGWNDFWCDGIQVPQSDTYTLTVDVVPNEEYTSILFIFGNEDDPTIKSGEIWVQNSDNLSIPGRVGVYAMGDTVTFTDFKVEPIEEEPEPAEPEESKPQETNPAPTEPQDGQEAPKDAPIGLIVGIVAAVVVVAAVVIILIKKKK